MNYYPFHIGDYAAATAHLSPLEDCFYRRALDRYYQTEKPLPADPEKLYRILRAATKQDRQAVDSVLAEFFQETQEGWAQARCGREILDYTALAQRNKSNGAKGGRPRKNTEESVGDETQALPAGSESETQNKGNQNQNQEPEPKDSSGQLTLTGTPAPKPKRPKAAVNEALQAACRSTWAAYSEAYVRRYKAQPFRDQVVNSQVKNFVKRVGYDDSPKVAAFYVGIEGRFYEQHPVSLLLRDAEKIRMQWATNNRGQQQAGYGPAPIPEAPPRQWDESQL